MRLEDVVWGKSVPSEVKDILLPILKKWFVILPTWCQDYEVRYIGEGEDLCTALTNFRNRWSVLTVTGKWVAAHEEDREVGVIHELIHVNLEPLSAATRKLVGDLTPKDTPVRELADTMYSDGLEGSTEDLARAFYRFQAQP